MNYRKVYFASNLAEAHMIQGLLMNESIETCLSGENLSTVWGGLQTDFSQVDILVNEVKYEKALEIISNYEKILKQSTVEGQSWECVACNKICPYSFEICWNCLTNHETEN